MRKLILVALLSAIVAGVGDAWASGTRGLIRHDHSAANKGGTTLSGTTISGGTLSGTTTVPFGSTLDVNGTLDNAGGTISGGTISGGTLSGTTTISGAFTGTAPCDSGYVRALPNLCVKQGSISVTTLTRDTCTSITLPTRAKALLIYFSVSVRSVNASGVERFARISAWADPGCATTRILNKLAAAYEFVATLSTEIAAAEGQEILQTPAATWLIFEDDAGNASVGTYEIRGYFDN